MANRPNVERLPDVAQVWISHKELIKTLYQGRDGQKKTLRQVRDILMAEYSFPNLPLSIYEVRFRDFLQLRKKMTKAHWPLIWPLCRALMEEGKVPEIEYCGSHIPWPRAWKEIRRAGLHKTPRIPDSELSPLPSGVRIVNSPEHVPRRDATAGDSQSSIGQRLATVTKTPRIPPINARRDLMLPSNGDEVLSTSDRVGNFFPPVPENGQGVVCLPSRAEVKANDISGMDLWSGWKRLCLTGLPWLGLITTLRTSISPLRVSFPAVAQFDAFLGHDHSLLATMANDMTLVHNSLFRSYDTNLQSLRAMRRQHNMMLFFGKAIFRLSNRLVDIVNPTLEDRALCDIMFSSMPPWALLEFFRSPIPSLKAAWATLYQLAVTLKGKKPLAVMNSLIENLHPDLKLMVQFSQIGQADLLDWYFIYFEHYTGGCDPEQIPEAVARAAVCAYANDNQVCLETIKRWGERRSCLVSAFTRDFVHQIVGITESLRASSSGRQMASNQGHVGVLKWTTVAKLSQERRNHRKSHPTAVLSWLSYIGSCLNEAIKFRDLPPLPHTRRSGQLRHSILIDEPYTTHCRPPFRAFIQDALAEALAHLSLVAKKFGRSKEEMVVQIITKRTGGFKGFKSWFSFLGVSAILGCLDTSFQTSSYVLVTNQRVKVTMKTSTLSGTTDSCQNSMLWVISDQEVLINAIRLLKRTGATRSAFHSFHSLLAGGVTFSDLHIAQAVTLEGTHTLRQIQILGADIGQSGGLAVAVAARLGNMLAVNWLLQEGVDLTSDIVGADGNERTVLYVAACIPSEALFFSQLLRMDTPCARLETVNPLISAGAPLHRQKDDVNTFDFLAGLIQHGNSLNTLAEMIPLFESMGHDLKGASALLEVCMWNGRREWMDYLIKRGVPFPQNYSLTYVTCETGYRSLKRPTVFVETETFHPPKEILAPILASCETLSLSSVKLQVARGADVMQRTSSGDTAIHIACKSSTWSPASAKERIEIVEYLISLGVDVNAQNNSGQAALHLAAQQGDLELAMTLLDHGAEVNDSDGRDSGCGDDGGVELPKHSCLCNAAETGRLDMVQLLLNAGASSRSFSGTPDPTDNALLRKAYSLAWAQEHFEVAALIKDFEGKCNLQ